MSSAEYKLKSPGRKGRTPQGYSSWQAFLSQAEADLERYLDGLGIEELTQILGRLTADLAEEESYEGLDEWRATKIVQIAVLQAQIACIYEDIDNYDQN